MGKVGGSWGLEGCVLVTGVFGLRQAVGHYLVGEWQGGFCASV